MNTDYTLHYWVFEANQLEDALAESDLSEEHANAVRLFLHSPLCQRLGMLRISNGKGAEADG